MRKGLVRFTVVSAVVLFGLSIDGCSKKGDSATGPSPEGTTTQISANGSLKVSSRTQLEGSIFASDQNGNAVTGLTSSNVSAVLRWGSGPQKVAVFDSVVGVVVVQTISQSGKSVAVALTMDYSGSMYSGRIDTVTKKYLRIANMESGVKSFVNNMKGSDIAEIIKFGSYYNVNRVQAFTGDRAALLRAADSASFDRGNTALYLSMATGIVDAAKQPTSTYAAAVIAFTDGGENDSYISRDSLFSASRRNAIPVYTIGLLDSMYHTTPPGQYSSSERDLVQIADTTGGFYFYAPDASQLAQIYSKISGQISNSYTVIITWPAAKLPPTGTPVTAVVIVRKGESTSSFSRNYTMP